jgi:hypothetical protein
VTAWPKSSNRPRQPERPETCSVWLARPVQSVHDESEVGCGVATGARRIHCDVMAGRVERGTDTVWTRWERAMTMHEGEVWWIR